MFHCKKLTVQITFLIVWIFTVVSCSSLIQKNKESNKVSKVVSVCQLTKKSSVYSQKDITVIGELTGFHHLVLTDSNCEGMKTAILVGMNKDLRQVFVEKIDKEIGQDKVLINGNFHLIVVLKGHLEHINYVNPESKCYIPKEGEIINPVIEYCLSVSSIIEIRLPNQN